MSDLRNELRQREQILDSEARPSAPKAQVGVRRGYVGPARRHGPVRAVGKRQCNSSLTVKLFRDGERKRPAAEGVKWVSYPNTTIR